MRCFKKQGELDTEEHRIYDLTGSIERIIEESGFQEGHVLIQSMHTTVGLYINENEERLFCDMMAYLNDKVPKISGKYRHDDIRERNCPPNEPENGHAHIKSTFYSNPSLALILSEGKLQLGRYQRILFAEFDGPCPRDGKNGKRKYLVHIIGE
jgi:secondary thiamine-phosphate synthase enzyme